LHVNYFFFNFFLIEVLCFSRSNIYLFFFLIIDFKFGTTALIHAAEKENFKILKFLIENNSDINIQDKVFFLFYTIFFIIFI
jgi:hypothetical protein